MSYARRDFYVKAVRTGLGDNQTIMPGTAGRDSGGIIAESLGGSALPSWIAVATMKHIATNFSAWTSSGLGLWRVPTGDLHLRRQMSRDFLCKNSGQSSLRFLFTVAAKKKKKMLSSPLFPEVLTDESDKIHWSSGHECLDLPQIITVPTALRAWNPSSPTPLAYGILELKRSQSFQGTREQNNILLSSAQLKVSVLVFEPNSP